MDDQETLASPSERVAQGANKPALTRATLSEALCDEVGLSRADSSALVERIIDLMSDELERGNSVKISSFGSFLVREKAARIGRNPRTGVEAEISARKVVVFKPSQILRARLNGENEEGIDEQL